MASSEPVLVATVGASAFAVDWERIREWGPVLDSAERISLFQDGQERVRVELDEPHKRWIAFRRSVNGSQVACVGYQETVGAIYRGALTIGGSNRRVLSWLDSTGRLTIGSERALGE